MPILRLVSAPLDLAIQLAQAAFGWSLEELREKLRADTTPWKVDLSWRTLGAPGGAAGGGPKGKQLLRVAAARKLRAKRQPRHSLGRAPHQQGADKVEFDGQPLRRRGSGPGRPAATRPAPGAVVQRDECGQHRPGGPGQPARFRRR